MSNIKKFYPEAKFGEFTDVDGTVAFFNRVNSLLKSSFIVLDVGCGRGAYGEDKILFRKNLRIIKGKVAKVIGIDIDKASQKNPFLDEFYPIEGNAWSIEKNSIDLILCDYVIEHINNPDKFFAEIRRVLKNGGFLCVRTPNLWSYPALGATLIPNRYHSPVTDFVQDSRKEEDVFPTVYKCNSVNKLKRSMKKVGFECVVYGYEAEPSYLSFSKVVFFLGVLHQRFAPKFFKTTLFAFGKIKKSS